MKLLNLSPFVIATVLTFCACEKEENETETNTTTTINTSSTTTTDTSTVTEWEGDAGQLTNFFANNETSQTQNFVIDAMSPILISGQSGTTVQFYGNSFQDASGNSISGNVDVELIEVYGKKDMLFLNKQTLGDNNGSFSPLVSGGEFKITASQGGNEVFLKEWNTYNLTIQAPDGVDSEMNIFFQNSATADTLTWEQADTSMIFEAVGAYSAQLGSLGWINCDRFMSQEGNQTTISVTPPKGLTNKNCALFISFDGLNSLTTLYNYTNGSFITGDYYTLPEGLGVHFIALSFINGVPHVAIVPSTITANHSEVIDALKATTAAQLAIDIANLP
jgi:hypothetical protein